MSSRYNVITSLRSKKCLHFFALVLKFCSAKNIKTKMNLRLNKSLGKRGAAVWNNLQATERLEFVLRHQMSFLRMNLISPSEITVAYNMPASAREYIVNREVHPIFSSIDIKKPAEAQKYEDRFKIALKEAFLL